MWSPSLPVAVGVAWAHHHHRHRYPPFVDPRADANPVYYDMYVYNITNVTELVNGGTPYFQEVGARGVGAWCPWGCRRMARRCHAPATLISARSVSASCTRLPVVLTSPAVSTSTSADLEGWCASRMSVWVLFRAALCLQLGPFRFLQNEMKLNTSWSDDGDIVRYVAWWCCWVVGALVVTGVA